MGVLDEAIRDHLDLRRRHGASEAELARAEAEALGPARRDPAAGIFSEGEPAPGDDETTILDPVVAEDLQPTLRDAPAAVDGEGEAAVYDLDHGARSEPAGEAPVEEPTVEEPPVEDEPPADDHPTIEAEAPFEEPPVDAEPAGHEDDGPAGEHGRDPHAGT